MAKKFIEAGESAVKQNIQKTATVTSYTVSKSDATIEVNITLSFPADIVFDPQKPQPTDDAGYVAFKAGKGMSGPLAKVTPGVNAQEAAKLVIEVFGQGEKVEHGN